ncbi:MAG: SUMF1/EgtB/PvdO family nonheme iron enzyme [Cyclobacteriaceae bacterium]|nr:SUMF1/EgtB/PvdO family nonheme iron enzyme [Cyclobacteriaceae bacterium]
MRILVILFSFFFSCGLFAQSGNAEQKWPRKLPYGTVIIPKLNILMDQYEVSVGNWFAFIYYTSLNSGNAEEVLSYFPDQIKLPLKYRGVFEKYKSIYTSALYLDASNFQIALNKGVFPWAGKTASLEENQLFSYPIVGVNYDQVIEYMLWIEEGIYKDKNIRKLENDGYDVNVRLITENEWQTIAPIVGLRDIGNSTVNPDSVNTHGCYLINVRYLEGCESMEKLSENYGDETFPVGAFFPDTMGLYDIYGNVAEMTMTEGICVGGSYFHWGRMAFPDRKIEFNSGEKWLGFRCVYELVQK